MKIFGKALNKKFIKQRKEDLGLTLDQIAEKSGLKTPYVKKIIYQNVERPSQETLYKLSKAFECKIDDLRNKKEVPFDSELLQECTTIIDYHIKYGNLQNLESEKIFELSEGLYNYAINRKVANKKPYIDEVFLNWFIDYMTK